MRAACLNILNFSYVSPYSMPLNNIFCLRVSTELPNTRIIDITFSKAINYQRELFRVHPNLKCSQSEGCVTESVSRQTTGSPPLAGTFKLEFNGQTSDPFSFQIRARDLENSVNSMDLFGKVLHISNFSCNDVRVLCTNYGTQIPRPHRLLVGAGMES